MSSILKVAEFRNKSHIVVDEEEYRKFERNQAVSAKASASFLGIGGSLSDRYSGSEDNEIKSKTLNDELLELNIASRDEVQWELEGTKVVPKTINVARLQKAKFRTSMTFSRVRLEKFNASFQRQDFAIDTMHAIAEKDIEVHAYLNTQKQIY